MVTRNLLNDLITVLLKEDEVTQELEKVLGIEEAPNQCLELVLQDWLVVFIFDCTPGDELLLAGSQGADTGIGAVADDECFIEDKEVTDLLLIGLKLIVGLPGVSVQVGWVL
jgi:hypothetical protein